MAIYSGFSHEKMVIFHSYVKLPEGRWYTKTGPSMFYQKDITVWVLQEAWRL